MAPGILGHTEVNHARLHIGRVAMGSRAAGFQYSRPWSTATSIITEPGFMRATRFLETRVGALRPGNQQTAPINKSAFCTEASIWAGVLYSSSTREPKQGFQVGQTFDVDVDNLHFSAQAQRPFWRLLYRLRPPPRNDHRPRRHRREYLPTARPVPPCCFS